MDKKIALLVLFLGIFLVGTLYFTSAVGEVSYCAERTVDGAWCQNVPLEKVDQKYQKAPTSCEATSYCKLGYCYDSQEGSCLPHVPQRVCNDAGGVWSVGEVTPPQCSLGCCVMGDQAAFVTQTRCKRLSSVYGLETNFRTDYESETECLASVTSNVEGACVFEKEFETTCQRLTQKECQDLGSGTQTEVSFYEGMLCSAEQLGTNCGPTEKTICSEDKDGVYFVDSCGNLANVYDSSKIKNKDYWAKIYDITESCSPDSSNAGSATCGNCDYYLGSSCQSYDKSIDRVKPDYGENICRDLSCSWEGKRYQHGETWCMTNTEKANSPGSEYFRLVCYNSEVTVENCAAFRQEVCVQDQINTASGPFRVAACSANLWQDCIAQDNKKDCENLDQRDCRWIENGEKDDKGEVISVCVPNYAPGFNFWEEGDAQEICPVADVSCVATFEKKLDDIIGGDKWDCIDNCGCCVNDDNHEGCDGTDDWLKPKMNICTALGDCGVKYNYIGVKGFYNESEAVSFS